MRKIENDEMFFTLSKGNLSVEFCRVGAGIYDIVYLKKHMNAGPLKSRYMENDNYFGKIAGRICGRVPGGNLTFQGNTYKVDINDGKNSLHGGAEGISTKVFNCVVYDNKEEAKAVFTYKSPDMEMGYPGNVDIKITYTLTKDDQLLMELDSLSDVDTPINLTNHTYYNLAADKDVLKHTIKGNIAGVFFAKSDTLVDTNKLVTFNDVDWKKGITIAELLEKPLFKNFFQEGIDHCFLFNSTGSKSLTLSNKGYSIEFRTSSPCFQIYSQNSFCMRTQLSNKKWDCLRSCLAIEPQDLPNNFDNMVSKAKKTKHTWVRLTFKKA